MAKLLQVKVWPCFTLLLMMISVIGFCSCDKGEDQKHVEEADNNDNNVPGKVEVYTLKATANECFFSPVGTLRGVRDASKQGTEYNKGWYFSHINQWSVKTDTIIWGITFAKAGKVSIAPIMAVADNQQGAVIDVILGQEKRTLELKSTGGLSNFVKQQAVEFSVAAAGTYLVKLRINQLKSSGEVGCISGCELSGEAVKDAAIYNRRWRPLAVHCKWGSSHNFDKVTISVHENTIITTDIDLYQPITTPFGYTGSTWNPKTQTFGGYNFSLWSYGANDPVPPFYQESHLIAVGKGLSFGAYGHEGTGVKPRGNHPYLGVNTKKQVIAVRKEPGEVYDTYWSYYLDPNSSHWKLYGCGRKYNKSHNISYLWTGAFVEVPGAPNIQRNGHIMREVQFRGWMMDKSRQWAPIDEMTYTGNDAKLSHKEWDVSSDGKRFIMRMGGMKTQEISGGTLKLANAEDLPDYLKGSYVDELYAMPASIEPLDPKEIAANSVTVAFNVVDAGENADVVLFYGTNEGLTKEDHWQNKLNIAVHNGVNSVSLQGLTKGTKYYYRVRITNDDGITWMMDTQTVTTL